jgi:hypothetical protein
MVYRFCDIGWWDQVERLCEETLLNSPIHVYVTM